MHSYIAVSISITTNGECTAGNYCKLMQNNQVNTIYLYCLILICISLIQINLNAIPICIVPLNIWKHFILKKKPLIVTKLMGWEEVKLWVKICVSCKIENLTGPSKN